MQQSRMLSASLGSLSCSRGRLRAPVSRPSLQRKGASARHLWNQGCPAQAHKPLDRQSNLSHQASSGGLRQNVAVRAVPETQAAGDVSEGSAEDALLEALPPPAQPFAVILGAGPTGAFMALLLAQQGWRVNVYDSRSRSGDAWETYTVAHAQNVVLGRRAQLCLERAEALQQVEQCSVRLLGQADIGRWGLDTFVRYPFTALSISEPDLAGALIRLGQERHRQQIRYHFGHRCTAVDFSSHGANFVDERSSQADRVASSAVFIKKSPPADLLIGADGPRSAMRAAMQTQTPMFGFSQVFSTREVHKVLRVLPAHADEATSSSGLPVWRPRWRTGGRMHLTHALFRVQRQLDGQRITCQLLPNQDGSFALSVRGQGLVSCSTVPDCQRLFETAFPQVAEALGMDAEIYQAFVAAPLCSEPLISCSRFHHNSAVLLGSAAHATFPDMHVSASAGLEDCVSLVDALREHGTGSPAVRRAAQAVTAARRPAALAAARLAAYAATPQNPLLQLLSGLRFHVLLACGSSFSGLLPWELKLLASEEDRTSLPAWRAQDNVLAALIVVSAALAITWGTAEISSQLFGSSALSELLQTAVRHAKELSAVLPKLWAALLAGITEGRRAFSAQLQAA